MRKKVESKCQRLLEIAAKSVDSKREDVYSAYSWARGKLDGIADAFLMMNEFELYCIARYYYDVADNKISKSLIWK